MGKLKDLVDFFFIGAGLLLSLLDLVLDIYTAVSFYQERAYMYLGILLLFLVGSSVLAQIFSWLLYSYDDFESCLSRCKLKLLHVFQLGSFFRWYESLRVATDSFTSFNPKNIEWYLNQYLGVLRVIETFSESAPQLVLMLTITLKHDDLDYITVLKAFGSASVIAINVTMHHRSMRSFLLDKEKQPLSSSVFYFFWNFLLMSSRLTALALFASVLPRFIFIHFVCSWIVLFFFAWRSKTKFMESTCGEWLYRATVGLIWYFHWFHVVRGSTRFMTLLYHGYTLTDIVLLCSFWYWKRSTEIPQLYAIIIAACVVSVYILGLLFRKVYYQCYHPNLGKDELQGGPTGQEPMTSNTNPTDVANEDHSKPSPPAPDVKHDNKRMKKLAENFYAS